MTVDAFGVYSLLTRLTKETYMTLTSLFPSRSVYEPFTVGFDKLFDQLQDTANNIAKNAPNWLMSVTPVSAIIFAISAALACAEPLP